MFQKKLQNKNIFSFCTQSILTENDSKWDVGKFHDDQKVVLVYL